MAVEGEVPDPIPLVATPGNKDGRRMSGSPSFLCTDVYQSDAKKTNPIFGGLFRRQKRVKQNQTKYTYIKGGPHSEDSSWVRRKTPYHMTGWTRLWTKGLPATYRNPNSLTWMVSSNSSKAQDENGGAAPKDGISSPQTRVFRYVSWSPSKCGHPSVSDGINKRLEPTSRSEIRKKHSEERERERDEETC